MISNASITAMAISAGIAILLPFILMIWFYRKQKISLKPVGVGALVFLGFVVVLEGAINFLLLAPVSPLAGSTKFISENAYLYSVYGGLMAGIFEECGRFLAFKYMLDKRREWKDGVAYGIGHGGLEAILVGISILGFMAIAVAYNNGALDGEVQGELVPIIESLETSAWYANLMSGLERAMAITVHIALSLIVLYAVRSGRTIFLLYSILLHALLNFPAGLAQKGVLDGLIVEGWVLLFAIAAIIFIIRAKKILPPIAEEPTGTSPQIP